MNPEIFSKAALCGHRKQDAVARSKHIQQRACRAGQVWIVLVMLSVSI